MDNMATNTTKTTTAIALAAAVATGVYVGVDNATDGSITNSIGSTVTELFGGSESKQQEEFVDDVTAVTVTIPKVEIPTVTLPEDPSKKYRVSAVAVDVPGVSKIITLTETQLAELNLPQVAIVSTNGNYSVTLDNVIVVPSAGGEYKVVPATVATTAIVTADPSGNYQVETAGVKTTVIITPNPDGSYKVQIPENLAKTVTTETVEVATVGSYTDRIPKIQELTKLQQALLRDKRSLRYDKNIGIDSKTWPKWRAIYMNETVNNFALSPVPVTKGIRMISETFAPSNSEQWEVLNENLEFYSQNGYNAVLFCFDGTESVYDCVNTVEFIKSKDMKVYFSYSGPEILEWSIFQDPDKIYQIITAIAPKCQGMLVGWRRTALHLILQDKPFTNYLMMSARSANRNIEIIGEAYWGANAESHDKSVVAYNIPQNCSATMINGVGFSAVNIKGVLNNLFPETKGMNRIGVVIGSNPYHMTRNVSKYDKDGMLKVKRSIEERFMKYGCIGTITIHGDIGIITDPSNPKKRLNTDMMNRFRRGSITPTTK